MVSMFSNFNFAWPPELVSLFHVFSLVNFNFDLLAPECRLGCDAFRLGNYKSKPSLDS